VNPNDFWARTERVGDCLLWIGTKPGQKGYARVRDNGRLRFAHRVAFELTYGVIAPGMTIDHECHNRDADCDGGSKCPHRRCVNPVHLQAKTVRENTFASSRTTASKNLLKTHCPQGHPYDYVWSGSRPQRRCFGCMRATQRRYVERKRQARSVQITAATP
jgi:hypothetical protein